MSGHSHQRPQSARLASGSGAALREWMPRSVALAGRSLHILAPAKVNLYLRILRRRADGYHAIESLMAPISLYDRLRLRLLQTMEIRLRCSDPTLPDGPENLAFRAASRFREHFGAAQGVLIELRKAIPAGAGLGGGSSDAAAVLIGLNRLCGVRATRHELARLAKSIGADVPFFIHGQPAVARGIGERITPWPSLPAVPLVVAWPRFSVSTAWAYRGLRLKRKGRSPSPSLSLRTWEATGGRVERILRNDLESVVCRAHAEIDTLRSQLTAAGALGTLMSGSGSAVFGVFRSQRGARSAASALRAGGLWARAAQTLAGSPVSKITREGPRISRLR